jgi:hypothetical protein
VGRPQHIRRASFVLFCLEISRSPARRGYRPLPGTAQAAVRVNCPAHAKGIKDRSAPPANAICVQLLFPSSGSAGPTSSGSAGSASSGSHGSGGSKGGGPSVSAVLGMLSGSLHGCPAPTTQQPPSRQPSLTSPPNSPLPPPPLPSARSRAASSWPITCAGVWRLLVPRVQETATSARIFAARCASCFPSLAGLPFHSPKHGGQLPIRNPAEPPSFRFCARRSCSRVLGFLDLAAP